MFGLNRIYMAEETAEGGGAAAGGAAARAVAGAATPESGGGAPKGDLPEWAAGISDDLAGRVREAKWQSPHEVVKSYDDLLRLQGAPADRTLKLPGPVDSEVARAHLAKTLGAPDSPDEYQFADIDVPEGVPNLAEALRGALHAARIPKDAAPQILKSVTDALSGLKRIEGEEADARFATASETLNQRWGGEANTRWANVARGYEQLGLPDEQADLLARQMGEEAFFLRMEDLGRRMGEPTTHGQGGSGAAVTTVTKEQAQARLKEITENPQAYKIDDPAVRSEIDRMAKIAYPGTVNI